MSRFDSPRFCAVCGDYGDHHTDRHTQQNALRVLERSGRRDGEQAIEAVVAILREGPGDKGTYEFVWSSVAAVIVDAVLALLEVATDEMPALDLDAQHLDALLGVIMLPGLRCPDCGRAAYDAGGGRACHNPETHEPCGVMRPIWLRAYPDFVRKP